MANPEHLDRLRQVVDDWNAWRAENPSIRPDLSRADLYGVDLYRANLSRAEVTMSANDKSDTRRRAQRSGPHAAPRARRAIQMDARLAPRGCFDLDHNRRRSDRRSAKGLADAMSQGLKFKLFHFWFDSLSDMIARERPTGARWRSVRRVEFAGDCPCLVDPAPKLGLSGRRNAALGKGGLGNVGESLRLCFRLPDDPFRARH
jgi:hypothetical protein